MSANLNFAAEKIRTASAKKKAVFVLFLLYSVLVLWYTVFNRTTDFYGSQFEWFWSYKKWLAGDWKLGWEILGNIGMFMPFGFMLSAILSLRKRVCLIVLCAGILFSCVIEVLQLELMRGLFEYDDIFNNALGAVLGYLAYRLLQKLTKGKCSDTIVLYLSGIFVVAGVLFCFDGSSVKSAGITNFPRSICFQVDKAVLDGNLLKLTGFAFGCEQPVSYFGLTLKSTKTGKEIKADVEYGLLRQDIAQYFNGEQDYTKTGKETKADVEYGLLRQDEAQFFNAGRDYTRTGFTATVSDVRADEEYEIFMYLKRFVAFPTGVYIRGKDIKGTDIHYTKQDGFIAPEVAGTALEEIVNKGYLRVYRPDRACYVYQYKGYLYWLADKGFHFENNGKTYMQYQLWTTQIDKLPQKRLKNHWYWDNIGGYFEKHEITDTMDCGRYRVCKRKLPTDYSITSIVTGYYKNGKWIWKNYFRPVYEF